MKNIVLTMAIALCSIGLYAQVGINTKSPTVTLEIARESSAPANKPQGVLFPKMTTTERNQMQNVPTGTMIYNTDKNCIDYYNGIYWQCSDGTQIDFSNGTTVVTADLGAIDPLRDWVALEYNGIYYSSPENGIANNATISVSIPYSNATSGAYIPYEQTFILPDKNGNSKMFKLSYPAGTINNTTGTITATLTNISGSTYYPQPQTPDGRWKDLASVQVTLNGLSAKTLNIQAIGGIPDRCFGKTTKECVGYGADVREHDFVYIPIKIIIGSYNKVWLNNNLGADYANINSPFFNPTQQATYQGDLHAYGSLFQWQRNPDGHELINWSSYNNGSPKYGTTSTLSNSWTNAGTNRFILNSNISNQTWVNRTGPFNLWQSGGTTNPCPKGFHVPTRNELETLKSIVPNLWDGSRMRLVVSGSRLGDGNFHATGASGHIWSSNNINNTRVWDLIYFSHNIHILDLDPARGEPCRCIQD